MVAVAVVGCGPSPEGWQRLSYHSLHEVERIVEIPDGYALLGARAGLVAYGHDDVERWQLDMPRPALALTRLQDDTLWVATGHEAAIEFARVSFEGALQDSSLVSVLTGSAHDSTVALDPSGQGWFQGTDWPNQWRGTIQAGGDASIQWSTMEERTSVLPTARGGRFETNGAWTDATGTDETLVLERWSEQGVSEWRTTIYAPGDKEFAGRIAGSARDGGVYVLTHLQGAGKQPVAIRHFDATGALVTQWTWEASNSGLDAPFLRPGGDVLWLDAVDDNATIRVRVLDEQDAIIDEARIAGDGTPIMDAVFIDDVLHVLTHDGLTKIAMPPLR